METATVIITGAGRGLGEALADALIATTGHHVISLSRRTTPAQDAFSNDRFSFIPVDFAREEDYPNIYRLKDLVHTPHIVLINNAAIVSPVAKAGSFSPAEVDRILTVNFRAAVFLVNYLLKNFAVSALTVLNISSGAARKPVSGWSLYCATKAAAEMFFQVVRQEYPQHRFISIDPGVMDTGMQDLIRSSDFALREKFIGYKERGLLRQPAEVAANIISQYLQ